MSRTKNVDGVDVAYTPEEEIKRDAMEAEWHAGADARAAAQVQANRLAAYQSEADKLFFEEQRGEVPSGTWAAKVAEIKTRIPKP